MITFAAVVIPGNRRADGTYPVKIRVTFRRKTRRLATTLVCTRGDLTRSLKIKNPNILNRADELIARMRGAVAALDPFELEGKDVDYVVARIREALGAEGFRLDFFRWADVCLKSKSASTRRMYETALNTLERFIGKRELDINDITRTMLQEFVDFCEAEPKMHYNFSSREFEPGTVAKIPRGASSRHLMKLAHIYNAAKDRYNDEDSGRIVIPRSPFASIKKVFPPSHGQTNQGVELIQRMIDAEPEDPRQRFAVDLFLLSFVLMGVNVADLWEARPFDGDVWIYNRAKVRERRADRAEMRVTVPPEAAPFVARLQDGPRGWWLPALHQWDRKDRVTAQANRWLSLWCEAEGVPRFTMGAARHSWATIARSVAKVEKATVDEALVHRGDYALTDIYAERSWDLFAEANRRVLDLFRW